MSVALVLRALGLGDLLVAVPALRALRRILPGRQVVLACPRGLGWLALESGAVDRVHPTAGLDDLAWPGPSPQVAVNLHGSGPQSHAALARVGAGRFVGFADPVTGTPGPAWDPREHEARRWCRLVEEGLGAPAGTVDAYDGLLRPPYAPVGETAVVHPGAASPARRWPAERFAEVARRLAALGHDVALTGSPPEAPLCREVARAAGLPNRAVLAGSTTVEDLAGVVARAAVVVSGDTGVAHLAAAYDRPAVAVFGPTPPSRWAPLWGRTTVLWHGSGDGDPHGARTDPALAAVGVEEVWTAVFSRIRPGTSAPSAPGRR